MLLRLHDRGPRIRDALLGIVFCAILIGWATDVLEVTTATLFLGMAIAHALTPQERHHPVATVSTHYGLELDKRKPRDDRP